MLRSFVVLFLVLGMSSAQAETKPTAPATQPASAPAPTPAAADPVALPGHEAAAAPAEADEVPLVEEDLSTRVELVRQRSFSLFMGGMIQVQGAFYVGDDAAIEYGDPADTEGFRIRRARFGFGGELFGDVGYYLAVDLKDAVEAARGGDQGSEILDAKIDWHRFSFARVVAGMTKAPYSAFALLSSSRLALIERPLGAEEISPDRRVGLAVEGEAYGLEYVAGVYNGSDGATSGNRLAGLAGAVHVQYHILGKPEAFVPGKLRISVGGGYMYDDGPAVNSHRASGNLMVQFMRARLQGEFLWMQTSPDEEPTGGPVEAGDVRRWGAIGEASAFVWRSLFQLALRYEYFKDNEYLPTFGTQQIISAGLNVYLYGDNLKLQVNYVNRDEREGPSLKNDIGFAQVQAMF